MLYLGYFLSRNSHSPDMKTMMLDSQVNTHGKRESRISTSISTSSWGVEV